MLLVGVAKRGDLLSEMTAAAAAAAGDLETKSAWALGVLTKGSKCALVPAAETLAAASGDL